MFKESKKIHQFLPNLQYRATDFNYDQLAYAFAKRVETYRSVSNFINCNSQSINKVTSLTYVKLNHVIIKWECWC